MSDAALLYLKDVSSEVVELVLFGWFLGCKINFPTL